MAQNPRGAMNALSMCHRISRQVPTSLRRTQPFTDKSASDAGSASQSVSQRSAYHHNAKPWTRGANNSQHSSRHAAVSQPTRSFSSSVSKNHAHLTPPKPGQERYVTFIDKDQQSVTFTVADGDNLLDIAQANDLEMEGACGGSCACSTCHVIVDNEEYFDKMEEPSDDENDMLDLAFGLTETSRLGCQVCMSKELDGLVVKLPSMTRNLQASDFAEKK